MHVQIGLLALVVQWWTDTGLNVSISNRSKYNPAYIILNKYEEFKDIIQAESYTAAVAKDGRKMCNSADLSISLLHQ